MRHNSRYSLVYEVLVSKTLVGLTEDEDTGGKIIAKTRDKGNHFDARTRQSRFFNLLTVVGVVVAASGDLTPTPKIIYAVAKIHHSFYEYLKPL